jgi:hypothetical protein
VVLVGRPFRGHAEWTPGLGVGGYGKHPGQAYHYIKKKHRNHQLEGGGLGRIKTVGGIT